MLVKIFFNYSPALCIFCPTKKGKKVPIHPIDLWIVFLYIVFVTAIGVRLGRNNKSASDYFLASQRVPWWAACLSIVATETSTLTFVSVPAVAYLGNLSFLQISLGYIIGRAFVAFYLLPKYFAGKLHTSYELMQNHYGLRIRRFTAALFQVTRLLADGVRLFATSIPLHLLTGWDYGICIGIIAFFTIIYTLTGGIKAVIWVDVIQTFIYIGGALVSLILLLRLLPDGLGASLRSLFDAGKLKIFETGFSGSTPFFQINYTLFSGLIGGAFLSMASHGTDHLIVQRLLCCNRKIDAQKALIASGIFVFLQFALFLFIGSLLYIYLEGAEMVADTIFPRFILGSLPPGVKGFIIAAIFAAAMSTLSSSINSLAASTHFDFFTNPVNRPTKLAELQASRLFSFLWGIILAGTAMLFRNPQDPVVELGLAIASYTYGGILGIFLLALKKSKLPEQHALFVLWASLIMMVWIIGPPTIIWLPLVSLLTIVAGSLIAFSAGTTLRIVFLLWTGMVVILLGFVESPQIAWPWYVPAGSLMTIIMGKLALRYGKSRSLEGKSER